MLASGESTLDMPENLHDSYQLQNAFPFLDSLCRVCKSLSTGVHYGVSTCEGCKGFFKRSIPKCQHYKCYFGGDCEITKETRNRCKSCRFQRCLRVGMALEAVKMGRIPKGERERAMKATDGANRLRIKSLKTIAPAPSSYNTATPRLSPIDPLSNSSSNKCNNPPKRHSIANGQISLSRCSSTTSIHDGGGGTNTAPPSPLASPSYNVSFYLSQPAYSTAPTASSYSPETTSMVKKIKIEDPSDPPFGDFMSSTIPAGNQGVQDHYMSPALSPVSEFGDHLGSDRFIESLNHTSDIFNLDRSSSSQRQHGVDNFTHGSHTQRASLGVINFGDHYEQFRSPTVVPRSHSMDCLPGPTVSDYSDYSSQNFEQNFDSDHDDRSSVKKMSDGQFLPLQTSDYNTDSRFPPVSMSQDSFSSGSSAMSDMSPPIHTRHSFDASISLSHHSNESGLTRTIDSAIERRRSVDGLFFGQNHGTRNNSRWTQSFASIRPETRHPGLTSFNSDDWRNGFAEESQYSGLHSPDGLTACPSTPSARETERINMLERIIQIVEDAGNEIYRSETTEEVEFMVRMWQEGRLSSDSPLSPETTFEKTRACLRSGFAACDRRLKEFAYKIPGLTRLHQSDIRILLEQGAFGIWMVQNAAFLVNNESYIMLPNGDEPYHYSRTRMQDFLPEAVINGFMRFADDMNSHQLSFLEMNILKTLIVVCPDREGLEDPKNVAKLRRVLQEALFQAFKRRQTASPEEMYRKIGLLIAHLDRLDRLYNKSPINLDQIVGLRMVSSRLS